MTTILEETLWLLYTCYALAALAGILALVLIGALIVKLICGASILCCCVKKSRIYPDGTVKEESCCTTCCCWCCRKSKPYYPPPPIQYVHMEQPVAHPPVYPPAQEKATDLPPSYEEVQEVEKVKKTGKKKKNKRRE
ncbi:Oidioi.mRNA.OKI2018_I69.PAR.g9437.t1.cds [Oikopleura dioica]|uniref:Oidioi.mRNA.OKI2018_I69.PAR.g9437.t1.cds n=1 Tax=Oikopleura dioica TaxID=34765 RepID=A0ABN7RKI6_OIKDI|nr:Oidioi.mRNA.OKI2018_I69.PAR.g9437.t1.cds [Oikopleura dioica]